MHIKEFSERRRKAPSAEAVAAAEAAEAQRAAEESGTSGPLPPQATLRGEMNKDYISAAIMVEKESQVRIS